MAEKDPFEYAVNGVLVGLVGGACFMILILVARVVWDLSAGGQ